MKQFITHISPPHFSITNMWYELKQSQSFHLLIYFYLLYNEQASQALLSNMTFQVDNNTRNIKLQSIVPQQLLTMNKNIPCSRPKPAPRVNDRYCPIVLATNLSYIHSLSEMEWNSWTIKPTCKKQWCRSSVNRNSHKAGCIPHRLPEPSY